MTQTPEERLDEMDAVFVRLVEAMTEKEAVRNAWAESVHAAINQLQEMIQEHDRALRHLLRPEMQMAEVFDMIQSKFLKQEETDG